jgi:hypothetical protein
MSTTASDQTIEVNARGGKQSAVPYAYHLVPPHALEAVANVLHDGAHYDTPGAPPNYLRISVSDHLNHAVGHIYKHLQGDTSERHMAHAACRLLMALEVSYEGLLMEVEHDSN